jgi:voltage-gated potassium channel
MHLGSLTRRQSKLDRTEAFAALERATELPLLILALAIIPLLLVPLFFELSPMAERVVTALDLIVWALFAIELAVKTYLAPSRVAYLRGHWYDVLIVALPFLRPLRIVRSARLLRLLRLARLLGFAVRAQHVLGSLLDRHGLKYVLVLGVLIVVACSSMIALVEQGNDSIDNYGDALWWAFATVTTVGYGDTVPTTLAGRAIAVLLMFVGITMFSIITANIASLLVSEHHDDSEPKLSELLAELRQVRAQLDELTASRARPDAS